MTPTQRWPPSVSWRRKSGGQRPLRGWYRSLGWHTSNLPLLSAGDRKRLIDRWKHYAAMAVDLYSQRQLIIDAKLSLLPRVSKSKVGTRVVVAREVLLGIDPTTVIRADGTKSS